MPDDIVVQQQLSSKDAPTIMFWWGNDLRKIKYVKLKRDGILQFLK